MSTTALNNLLEYLYGTLSPSNMRWVGEHLIEHAKKTEENTKPYSMEEINAIIDQSEREIAEGRCQDFDEAMHEIEEDFARNENHTK